MPNNNSLRIGNRSEPEQGGRIRFRIYCIAAACSLLYFAIWEYFAIMMQYPPGQFPPMPGVWMYAISAVGSGLALVIGFGKYRGIQPPILRRPLGLLLTVAVAIVLVLSVIAVIQSVIQLTGRMI